MIYYLTRNQLVMVEQALALLKIDNISASYHLYPDDLFACIKTLRTDNRAILERLDFVENRLAALILEYDKLANSFYPESEEVKAKVQSMEVFSGFNSYALFKEKLFDIDVQALGFTDFVEFVSITGAYYCNYVNRDFYESNYYWETSINGSLFLNRYYRNVHGDFRFIQYDISPRKGHSEFDDPTHLFRPESVTIYAYHSVEVKFFATLLRYAIETQTHVDCLANYPQFCEELLAGYPDRSDRHFDCDYFCEYLLETPINDINNRSPIEPHALNKEFKGYVHAYRENDCLVYLPVGVRFCPRDIEHLIRGLHFACRDGFGRTVVEQLITFYSEQEENFKTQFTQFSLETVV